MMCPQTFDLYFYGLRKNPDQAFDGQRFTNEIMPFEKELQSLNNSVRIGVWTSQIGWQPR